MVLLLGLNRQRSALELQKTVTDATNEMMRQASEMMKSQAIEIEKQSQRGIVDIETLEKTNRDLLDTISGVLKVQQEGHNRRAEIERRMKETGFEVVDNNFLRGKKFAKDTRTAEQKLLDMPCSETVH